jgi:putative hydrolase of the HAD superfamily
MRPVVVFDGDDTLWFVEHLYDRARDEAGALVGTYGLDPVDWEGRQRKLDVANVATMGVQAVRFPTSCARAYAEAAVAAGQPPSATRLSEVFACAAQVFDWPATPADGAAEVLEELTGPYRLALLTKGDPWVQKKRISDSGLDRFFDHSEIVENKTAETFRWMLDFLGAEPANSWSIGNSLPSDINPALSIGMAAVWVDAHVWEHERREVHPVSGRLLRAATLRDVPAILQTQTECGR